MGHAQLPQTHVCGSLRLGPHDAVEVQFHLAVDDAFDAFGQAGRLVVGFADADDFAQRGAGGDAEGALVDDLVPGVEVGNDEVDRRSVGQHVALEGIVVRLKTREWRQQSVVQIDDPPPGELPANPRGQHAHVPGQHDIVDIVLVDQLGHLVVVRLAARIADVVKRHIELLGQSATRIPVPDHHSWDRLESAIANVAQDGVRRLAAVGRTEGDARWALVFIPRPSADREALLDSDLLHPLAQVGNRPRLSGPVDP